MFFPLIELIENLYRTIEHKKMFIKQTNFT